MHHDKSRRKGKDAGKPRSPSWSLLTSTWLIFCIAVAKVKKEFLPFLKLPAVFQMVLHAWAPEVKRAVPDSFFLLAFFENF